MLHYTIHWVTSARYLGVYLKNYIRFKCSFANNKAKFFKAFNNIIGKVGCNASEEVLFSLITRNSAIADKLRDAVL